MRVQTLIEELEQQKPLKWDEKIQAAKLAMIPNENHVGLQLNGKDKVFQITKPCHTQIAERLEIPVRYYQKMEQEARGMSIAFTYWDLSMRRPGNMERRWIVLRKALRALRITRRYSGKVFQN